jgi:hypothetical protein
MMFSLNLKKKQIFDLEIKICNSLDMKDIYHFMIDSIKNWFFGFFNKNISIFWKMKKGINKIKFNQIMNVLYFVLFLLLLAERMDENMP